LSFQKSKKIQDAATYITECVNANKKFKAFFNNQQGTYAAYMRFKDGFVLGARFDENAEHACYVGSRSVSANERLQMEIAAARFVF
jgi:hypothetical protein